MSKPLNPSTEQMLQRVMDLGERLIIVLLFAGFVARLSHTLELRPYNALALVSEGLMVLFIVIRRRAASVSTRPMDWVLALLGTMLPLMVRPGGTPPIPVWVGTTLMFAGLAMAVWAKLSLRRSFGVAAANRGVVQSGAYRVVRHPMYAGYILIYLGFLLNNPLAWNAALYSVATALQVARLLVEEKVLAQDPAYAAMMLRVRHRLVPGIF